MKSLPFIIAMLLLAKAAFAQGIYRGGGGGGWASVSYQTRYKATHSIKIFQANGNFLDQFDGLPNAQETILNVYDCQGRKLEYAMLAGGISKTQLTKTYAKGLYLVVIEARDRKLIKKIIF